LDRTQRRDVLRRKEEREFVRHVDVRDRDRLLLLHRADHALAELDRLHPAARQRAREEAFDDRLESTLEVAQDPHLSSFGGAKGGVAGPWDSIYPLHANRSRHLWAIGPLVHCPTWD